MSMPDMTLMVRNIIVIQLSPSCKILALAQLITNTRSVLLHCLYPLYRVPNSSSQRPNMESFGYFTFTEWILIPQKGSHQSLIEFRFLQVIVVQFEFFTFPKHIHIFWDTVILVAVCFGVLQNYQGCDNEEEAAYDPNLEH